MMMGNKYQDAYNFLESRESDYQIAERMTDFYLGLGQSLIMLNKFDELDDILEKLKKTKYYDQTHEYRYLKNLKLYYEGDYQNAIKGFNAFDNSEVIVLMKTLRPVLSDISHYWKAKSYLEDFELPYLRIPGFQKIKNNDIVVFNWPVDTMLNMYYTDKYHYKPIDKKTNYVKRSVGIAGDTLEIKDGYVYINGEKNKLNDRAELQFSYLVQPKNRTFSKKVMVNNYDVTDPFGIINRENTYKFIAMSDKTINKFKNHPNVGSIEKDLAINGQRDSNIFPHNENYNWNNDFFGPIYIPKSGAKIKINKERARHLAIMPYVARWS
jgi:hypothetical protein